MSGERDSYQGSAALVPVLDASGGNVPAVVLEQLGRYGQAARGAFAANTERAIRADLAVFAAWCAAAGVPLLPADPDALARFVDATAAGRAVATVRRYLSSIAHLHRAAGLPNPAGHDVVRLALRRLARDRGVAQRQAHGLTRRLVDRMLHGGGDSPRERRDRALLATAYDTLGRRAELVALRREDLVLAADGHATVTVRRSKTDQEGRGAECFLASDTVRRLLDWLAAAGIEAGPLFRSVRRGGKTVGGALDAGDVARVFKRMARAVGLDAALVAGISGHSSRVGAAQDMAASDRIELPAIMQAGRWQSPEMVARYTRKQAARRSGSAKLAELQNRT